MANELTAILFALGREALPFRRLSGCVYRVDGPVLAWRNERGLLVVQTGMGAANSRAAFDWLVGAHRPARVVSAGFCGSLVEEYRVGALLRPTAVFCYRDSLAPFPVPLALMPEGAGRSRGDADLSPQPPPLKREGEQTGTSTPLERAKPSPMALVPPPLKGEGVRGRGRTVTYPEVSLKQYASGEEPPHSRPGVALVSVSSPVLGSEARQRLHAMTGAAIVDMESATVAHCCAKAGIAFDSLRVVSDDLREPLPPELASLLDGERVLIGPMVKAFLRRPTLLLDLCRLARQSRMAAQTLAAGLMAMTSGAQDRGLFGRDAADDGPISPPLFGLRQR